MTVTGGLDAGHSCNEIVKEITIPLNLAEVRLC